MKRREKSYEQMAAERGVTECYAVVLSMMTWGALRAWQDRRDTWAVLNATPEQKRLAFEVACYVPDEVREETNG